MTKGGIKIASKFTLAVSFIVLSEDLQRGFAFIIHYAQNY